jgi:hypothetical protein
MDYAKAVTRSVRLAVRNPYALVLVSVATTVSLLPFVTGLLIAGPVGGLAGLWFSSFLLGFTAAGGARIMTAVTERNLSLGTRYFWEGCRQATVTGPAVGVGTFLVAVVAIGLTLVPVGGLFGTSLAVFGVYLLLAWYVVVMFALPLWAALDDPLHISEAFSAGGGLILERPAAAGWLLVQTVGWSLLSVPLFVAPALLLPGFLQLVATGIVIDTAADRNDVDAADLEIKFR